MEGLIERRDGSSEAKEKAKLFLRSFGEELTVIEAGRTLGLNEGRAHVWRDRILQAVIEAMEPRRAGRPRRIEPPDQEEVARLKEENAELRRELAASRVREELSAVLRRPAGGAEKKTTRG